MIRGKAYVLGDNIDTDQIIPAEFLNLVPTIPDEYRLLGSLALAGLPDSYPPFMTGGSMTAEYTVLVAGRNFGCGSSREHAPVCLGAAGIQAVVAETYARIFFRNAVATGELFPLESEERLCDVVRTGDTVEIDLGSSTFTCSGRDSVFALHPLGDVAEVVRAGGIFGYARETGMIAAK
ncbi:MAG: 3-isopropylmalate dehydratase [Lentisphaerae bacterium]|nr:3-isopropylmalate dehydratase [Lentisphaerota bacterium]